MKNILIILSLTLLIIMPPYALVESSPKYVQISNQKQIDSDKIVVYEFFWYGCPHCYNLEPTMDKIEASLKKDTILIKVPVALRDTWENHAKAFYALQQMKLDDDLHEKIFNEIHINSERLDTRDALAQFVSNEGFDGEKFKKVFDSFGTEMRLKKASRLARQYQITSVPTLVVNGKYRTSGSHVSPYDELIGCC